MWCSRTTPAAFELLLVGVVLVGQCLTVADAQVKLAPTGSQQLHSMRRSLLAQSLTCDGKVHELSMPDTPYPETIPFAPIVNQPFFACIRPKQGLDAESNGECGAAPRYECENHVFEPVLYGSGQTPGIISPNNPVTINLKEDSDFYLTYLEWTAVDVGTAGARLRGVYGANSDLSPVTVNYAWTWNGRNALGEFGPCSSCAQDKGIKMLNVSAIAGAGFRSMQLSQMFVNTQCAGGAGVNYDGLYWHGMKYACVRPTCGDTDLDTADAQRFAGCSPSTAFAYNPKAENNTILSVDSCCLPVTCENTAPVKNPGQVFTCPEHREFDPTKATIKGPSVDACCSKAATCDDVLPISKPGQKYQCAEETHQYNPSSNKATPPAEAECCAARTCANYNPITNPGERFECPADTQFNPAAGNKTDPTVSKCCKPATCGNVMPVTKPGVQFNCPEFREFDPTKADSEAPNADRCCSKVSHCSDVSPISKPGTAYQCPANSEYNPVSALTEKPSEERCCKVATCGNVSPVTNPNIKFECPAGSEFNPVHIESFPPSAKSCCKPATCADVQPVSKPGAKFECPVHTEFIPEQGAAFPPSKESCCKVATCENVLPVSTPGKKFKCPTGTQFNPQAAAKLAPSVGGCCVPATCSNVLPVTKPGIRFACPDNRQFDPKKIDNVLPSDDNCCSKPNSCDNITPVSEPGVKFECPAFREFDPAKASTTAPSEERCCSKEAHCADIHPISAPGTKFACPADSEFNPAAANVTRPDEGKCCKRASCGNMRPVSKANVMFACPEFSEFDPGRTAVYPPRPDSCCKAATCADVKPITKAGVKFVCPEDRQYDPTKSNSTSPTVKACCSQPATCANTKPITAAGTAFVCPSNKEFNPLRAESSPVNEEACCSKAFTCGAIRPFSRPGMTFDCAPFREFDPSKNATEKPSESNCCSKPKTCGDYFPISSPRSPFPCGNTSEYNPAMAEAWPASEGICCKPASCGDVKPVSSPGERFSCPKQSEYDIAKDGTAKPSADTCCKIATCSDLQPISKPGIKFACPADTRFNPDAVNTTSPGPKICCQSVVDVSVKKEVSGGASTTQRAGSILLYRMEVTVASNSSRPADTVTMVDAMPEGMTLVAVVEEPDEGVCKHDESGVTCIWEQFAPGDVKVVTVTANASRAGPQPSIAAVTTSSLDINPSNNKATVDVTVLGACCTKGPDNGDQCSDTLAEKCSGGSFMPMSTCAQINICAVAPDANSDSAGAEDAMESVAAAVGEIDKLAKGACCVDDACTDSVKKEDCAGIYSAGAKCSDSKMQCGVFHIAAATSGTEKPRTPTRGAESILLGACCVDGQCSEVVESDCTGSWTLGTTCAEADCSKTDSVPRGACCNAVDGSCADGIPEAECAAPGKWTRDGKCAPGGVCTGACCDSGKCSQKLKKDCPGEWTLYKDCKLDTCPKPPGFVAIASVDEPICLARWQKCGKALKKKETKEAGRVSLRAMLGLTGGDKDYYDGPEYQCCEGTTCQYTYEGCKAGRFVCKPSAKCVKADEPCGGSDGGHCCKGLTCVWDYGSKSGTCQKVERCIKEGAKCQSDSQCCRGNRCKNGECQAPICWKRCSDYRCYQERRKDCDAMLAAAASG